MKFLLQSQTPRAAIQKVGSYLRAHGTGRHWIEIDHGRVFVNVFDPRDVHIMHREFPSLAEPVVEERPTF